MTEEILQSIARVIGLPFDEIYLESELAEDGLPPEDYFQDLPAKLYQYKRYCLHPAQIAFCQNEADARFAIQSMRDGWQLHLQRSESLRGLNQFEAAHQKLNRQYPFYENRYLKIWKRNPYCIQFSYCSTVRTGVSFVLPVIKDAYDRMRNGGISFMDITDQDILEESQHIILDSAVELPTADNIPWYQLTKSLSFSIFFQATLVAVAPLRADFRLMSFAASPTNMKRLAASGFVDCQTEMPEFGYSIVEFSRDNRDLIDEAFDRSSTTQHYASLLKRYYPSKAVLKTKRLMMLSAMAAYQKVIKPRRQQRKAG